MANKILIALVLAMAIVLPISHWQTYNAGVRTGYDAVATAIGVTSENHVIAGDAKITAKGIYHKPAPEPRFIGICSNCHTEGF